MRSPRLDPTALRDWLAEPRPPRVLDVRTPAEFETAHIPGSYNVPLDLLREHTAEIAGHLDRGIVLVCRSGQRAAQAEQALAGAGLPRVHLLDGGLVAWQRQAAPVTAGRARWAVERQVRLVAGGLVLLFVLGGLLVPGLQYAAAAIGAGLAVAALTDTCAMGMLLGRLPYNRGASCDLDGVVGRLRSGAAG
ncbi:rhodanese-like domain-containing protein [Hamadaea tsunoensis]|uniref:rhodanese-like domain-containing protein n=1 Tax=Hamadaea tsunoensis TaxID=53368 RepID=UPI0003F965D5|nr:rhodanese-like domain-containing protein [Hamadaea tsunoensis]